MAQGDAWSWRWPCSSPITMHGGGSRRRGKRTGSCRRRPRWARRSRGTGASDAPKHGVIDDAVAPFALFGAYDAPCPRPTRTAAAPAADGEARGARRRRAETCRAHV